MNSNDERLVVRDDAEFGAKLLEIVHVLAKRRPQRDGQTSIEVVFDVTMKAGEVCCVCTHEGGIIICRGTGDHPCCENSMSGRDI